MGDIKLGVIEAKFADMIWQNEPVLFQSAGQTCAGCAELEKIHDLYRPQTAV